MCKSYMVWLHGLNHEHVSSSVIFNFESIRDDDIFNFQSCKMKYCPLVYCMTIEIYFLNPFWCHCSRYFTINMCALTMLVDS